jgi:hypothetical protein
MATAYDALPRNAAREVDWPAIGVEVLTHDDEGAALTVRKGDTTYKGVILLRVVDLDKARPHMGDDPILAGLDGQSFRVAQQDVSRTYLAHCYEQKPKVEPIRTVYEQRLWNRLIGIKAPSVRGTGTKTVTVIVVNVTLPSGDIWTPTAGDDTPVKAQLLSAWLANLVDEIGMPMDAARAKVAKMDSEGKFDTMLQPQAK